MSDDLTYSIATEAVGKEAEAWLQSGKVGCVVLAGGVGSRFGSEKPKGTFPISAVKHKSLFELIADRVRVQSAFGPPPAFAIMTSEATHDATLSFFSPHLLFRNIQQLACQ